MRKRTSTKDELAQLIENGLSWLAIKNPNVLENYNSYKSLLIRKLESRSPNEINNIGHNPKDLREWLVQEKFISSGYNEELRKHEKRFSSQNRRSKKYYKVLVSIAPNFDNNFQGLFKAVKRQVFHPPYEAFQLHYPQECPVYGIKPSSTIKKYRRKASFGAPIRHKQTIELKIPCSCSERELDSVMKVKLASIDKLSFLFANKDYAEKFAKMNGSVVKEESLVNYKLNSSFTMRLLTVLGLSIFVFLYFFFLLK